MHWSFGGFCEVRKAIFRILTLFSVMMPLGKNTLFSATLKNRSKTPLSRINLKPFFFSISDLKIGAKGPLSHLKAQPVTGLVRCAAMCTGLCTEVCTDISIDLHRRGVASVPF